MVNKLFVVIPVAVVAIAAAAIALAYSSTVDTSEVFNNPTESEESRLSLFRTGSPVLGSADAPLTMIEFGDYQCLNCNRFFHNTEEEILRNYVETGKLKIIFMDFAFIGPDSLIAAEAAHCAQEQGKYWEYHDVVYSNWDGENTGWANMHNLKRFADDAGLDHRSFNECLDSGKYAGKVRENMNIGRQLGVSATPTFFVFTDDGNVQKIVGSQPYSTFSTVMDAMLRE